MEWAVSDLSPHGDIGINLIRQVAKNTALSPAEDISETSIKKSQDSTSHSYPPIPNLFLTIQMLLSLIVQWVDIINLESLVTRQKSFPSSIPLSA